jgi:hypothetical protein
LKPTPVLARHGPFMGSCHDVTSSG